MQPYYSDDAVTIYHADCREVLSSVCPAAVDLVLTDPPYNRGLDYGPLTDDQRSDDDYEAWCRVWFGATFAVCRRVVVFPGHGRIGMWDRIRKPSAIGCWLKPGNFASGHLGMEEWEPWCYWGTRVGGSSVVRAPLEVGQHWTGDHPCPKPVRLMERLLLKFKSEVVLDPFLGTGTTALAAKLLGRRAVGVEISERYCEIAARRLSQEVLDFGGVA